MVYSARTEAAMCWAILLFSGHAGTAPSGHSHLTTASSEATPYALSCLLQPLTEAVTGCAADISLGHTEAAPSG